MFWPSVCVFEFCLDLTLCVFKWQEFVRPSANNNAHSLLGFAGSDSMLDDFRGYVWNAAVLFVGGIPPWNSPQIHTLSEFLSLRSLRFENADNLDKVCGPCFALIEKSQEPLLFVESRMRSLYLRRSVWSVSSKIDAFHSLFYTSN